MTVKIVSWNIAAMIAPWHCLATIDADVALLQEAGAPPEDLEKQIEVNCAPWRTDGWLPTWPYRTAIAKLSDRVKVEWVETKRFVDAGPGDLGVSRLGTVTAAHVTAPGIEPFVAVSLYTMWENPHASAGRNWILADASAHRLVSDLSAFIGKETGHRILATGDLNILYGYGDGGSEYWAGRYGTVFDRMEALGLSFVGPQHPNGRQADPWPDELPPQSENVPTYYRPGKGPADATRQLDFVFASKGMADSVNVRALNEPSEWGPSDHCRVVIEVS